MKGTFQRWRNPSRGWRHYLLLAALALFAIYFALFESPMHKLGWIDPVTGSMKTRTRWFGIATSTVVEQSALEKWVISREGAYTNHWQFLYDTSYTVFGSPTCYGCGRAPENYSLHAGSLIEDFVQNASDQQIRSFLQAMRTGTGADKNKAVSAAAQIALKNVPAR